MRLIYFPIAKQQNIEKIYYDHNLDTYLGFGVWGLGAHFLITQKAIP